MNKDSLVHVAVGVVISAAREVLVSRRHPEAHQGGLLEFPGGKYEPGEDRFSGLQREFREELGIEVTAAYPLKKIVHHYTDKSVLLDVWLITEFSGQPAGLEGQEIQWLPLNQLASEHFPAANEPIINILRLPPLMGVTPNVEQWSELRACLAEYLAQGITLIQLRQTALTSRIYCEWYQQALEFCGPGVTLMFSHAEEPTSGMAISGLHCNARQLMALEQRPCALPGLFAASCHNLPELEKAEALGADYVTLSPVAKTAKYDAGQLLGWSGFVDLRRQVSLPVFALGGMTTADAAQALACGAHGIAGIRLFLSGQ